MQWSHSSQSRRWIFTPATLLEARRKAHDQVSARSQQDPSLKPFVLSFAEEQTVQAFMQAKISALVGLRAKSYHVEATATSYYKRFFLARSVMEYSPKLVMAACVYLACKSEEEYFELPKMVNTIADKEVTVEEVAKMEYVLIEALHFDLAMHHPLQPLKGFVFDIQNALQKEFPVFDAAKRLLELSSVQNDIQFLFPPSQIALAALMRAVSEGPQQSFKKDLEDYLVMNFHALPDEQWQKILAPNLEKIQKMLVKPDTPNPADVKTVWKKLSDFNQVMKTKQAAVVDIKFKSDPMLVDS